MASKASAILVIAAVLWQGMTCHVEADHVKIDISAEAPAEYV